MVSIPPGGGAAFPDPPGFGFLGEADRDTLQDDLRPDGHPQVLKEEHGLESFAVDAGEAEGDQADQDTDPGTSHHFPAAAVVLGDPT